MKIKVHLNKTKSKQGNAVYSVLSKQGKSWKVIDYKTYLWMGRSVFHVQKGGSEKAKRTGVRNVHAFVIGEACDEFEKPKRRATYNPFEHNQFVDSVTQEPITEASRVWFGKDGVWYEK